MSDSLAAVVLAAGSGTRLLPLSRFRPKVLCPVDQVALLDHAIARVDGLTSAIAVNVHHHRKAMEEHLAGRPLLHVSFEPGEARGTAGALGLLRPWMARRDVLVVNGDTWCPDDLGPLLDGWDGERIRVLVHGAAELRSDAPVAGALMPWAEVAKLGPEPTGLYEVSWRAADTDGRLEVLRHDGPFVDCATPADYLRANLQATGGASVVPDDAVVAGTVERTVLWPGTRVEAGERLVDAIRANRECTVLVR